MKIKALLLGSIGVLCETSKMQRHAFNATFKEAGIDWSWEEPEYEEMLERPGGAKRIADYAAARGETVDAVALHRRKTEIFQEMLRHAPLSLRPGVADTLIAARVIGLDLGLASTTDIGTIEAMLDQSRPRVVMSEFRFIGHRDLVARPKPSPDIYLAALKAMDLAPNDALAVEDSPESAAAAIAAGIKCLAFPGAAHRGRDFGPVATTVATLSPSTLGLEAIAVGARPTQPAA